MKFKNLKSKFVIDFTLGAALIIILSAVLGFGYYRDTTNDKEAFSKASFLHTDSDNPFKGNEVMNDDKGVPVICYHSITDDEDNKSAISLYSKIFRKHMEAIKNAGYLTLTMADLDNYLESNEDIPEKSVLITFDDGYADNYYEAYKILKEFDMKATIFMISDNIDKPGWLTSDQLKEMSEYGIDIESHTLDHQELGGLSYEEQLYELSASRESLEELLNKPVISVAYPCGSYNDDTIQAVKDAGYRMGFTIKRGQVKRDTELAEIKRNCVDYTYSKRDIIKLLRHAS